MALANLLTMSSGFFPSTRANLFFSILAWLNGAYGLSDVPLPSTKLLLLFPPFFTQKSNDATLLSTMYLYMYVTPLRHVFNVYINVIQKKKKKKKALSSKHEARAVEAVTSLTVATTNSREWLKLEKRS